MDYCREACELKVNDRTIEYVEENQEEEKLTICTPREAYRLNWNGEETFVGWCVVLTHRIACSVSVIEVIVDGLALIKILRHCDAHQFH